MQTIQIKQGLEIGLDELVWSMSRLPSTELVQFMEQLQQTILGKRQLTPLEQEIVLLQKIKAMIPGTVVRRLKALQKKRRTQSLSSYQQQEILMLSDFIENQSAERIYLVRELAQLRQMPVKELVKLLDLKTFYG
ncbi:MAG: hypothetical protein RLZZ628_4078 [Bacteroidota bacterium]|jgi:hypothetical protein